MGEEGSRGMKEGRMLGKKIQKDKNEEEIKEVAEGSGGRKEGRKEVEEGRNEGRKRSQEERKESNFYSKTMRIQ